MIFQVRTDSHIENSQELKSKIRDEVDAVLLPRYADRLRRVEVYLEDTNSSVKGGGLDKRCNVEVHLDIASSSPVVVEDRGDTVEHAVNGALEKVLRALEKTLGRRQDRGDTISMSGQET